MVYSEEIKILPVVALRGVVVFPEVFAHFEVGREKSINAVQAAMKGDRRIFLAAQREISVEDASVKDLYSIGVIARVKQILKVPGSTHIRVSVEGITRAKIVEEISPSNKFLKAAVCPIEEESPKEGPQYIKALVRRARDSFAAYTHSVSNIAPDIVAGVIENSDPGRLADFIAGNIVLDYEDRQLILEQLSPEERLEELCVLLAKETDLNNIEAEISEMVQEQIDKNQREYYLREQLKIISSELGGGVPQEEELDMFREKIFYLKTDEDIKEKLFRECDRLEKYSPSSPEAAVSRNYIEACLELPWGKYSKENSDLKKSRKILENDHYGLEKVKERILEYLAVHTLAPDITGQIICLVGPPGVGKTSIARSIAKATGRKYARISLGGVKDEAEIRGHRKTYIGSMPGRIINALQQAGTSNPLILLDEVDKLSADYKGDPTSALLEVLDPEQNFSFRDHYIELPFDLSKVMFITTANVRSNIPEPLQDRMEIIELGSYTAQEKLQIAKKHLLPKQIKRHGMTSKSLKISDKALECIIDGYTREAGVRLLEQQLAAICRKAAMRIAENGEEKLSVKPEGIEEYLGTRKYKPQNELRDSEIGVVNGLAWTAVGGEMLEVEAAVLDGTGKIELTGSLGEVMQESAKAAVSYIRAKASELGISNTFYKDKDIHIHVPEGATPKDGPSAGITIATALVSALMGKRVKSDAAMTGEITLRGRVLPIGGLKEKSMAAYKHEIKTVYIPYDNISDLDEVESVVKANVSFVPVRNIETVWADVLEDFKQESEMKIRPEVAEKLKGRAGAKYEI